MWIGADYVHLSESKMLPACPRWTGQTVTIHDRTTRLLPTRLLENCIGNQRAAAQEVLRSNTGQVRLKHSFLIFKRWENDIQTKSCIDNICHQLKCYYIHATSSELYSSRLSITITFWLIICLILIYFQHPDIKSETFEFRMFVFLYNNTCFNVHFSPLFLRFQCETEIYRYIHYGIMLTVFR